MTDKILDKDITFSNYANFKDCQISNFGKLITFVMASCDSYDVDLDHFLRWYKLPHYKYKQNELIEWNSNEDVFFCESELIFIRTELILSKTAVQVYLSNGVAYTVSWDTVLMACEKRYEHFGGLTDESRRITFERRGS